MLGLRALNLLRGTRWMTWPAGLPACLNTIILWPGTVERVAVRGCINLIPLPVCATFDPVVLSAKVFSGAADPDPGPTLTTGMEPSNQKQVSEYFNFVHK